MTLSSAHPALTLGAYALTPGADLRDGAAEEEFYAGLAGLGIEAIELPFLPSGAPGLQPDWLAAHLRPEWQLMVTCIPRTMVRLGSNPSYGLASTDPDARAAALADLAAVRDLAHTLADDAGHPRVTSIEVHSAPGPRHGSLDAFASSLDEILSWDLGGARLVVEHCDALVPGQAAAKGFWALADEIACVRKVLAASGTNDDAHDAPLGIGINWGRSAIEGRSAATPVAHIEAAATAGLLRSIIFSGATDQTTAWGPAWADAHIAPRGDDPALAASQDSLLGATELAAALDAAGDAHLENVGIKVTQPAGTEVADRLAVARVSLGMVRDAAARG